MKACWLAVMVGATGCGALSAPRADASVSLIGDGSTVEPDAGTAEPDAGAPNSIRADGGVEEAPRPILVFEGVGFGAGLDSSEIVALAGGGENLWALQKHGRVLRFDGSKFQPLFSLRSGTAMWVSGNDVVVASNDTLFRAPVRAPS